MDTYLTKLTELRDLLASVGDKYWLDGVEDLLVEYQKLCGSGASQAEYRRHLQKVAGSIAGGMGSLTDLTFSAAGGHVGDEESLRLARRKKEKLLGDLYQLCMNQLGR